MDWAGLKEKGWTSVDGISSASDLMELGKTIGQPVPAPTGEYVKEIRRLSPDEAPPGSQSALYGTGPFPLHTDTVFWPVPVRYVLLRAYGDTRRPTTIMSFSNLLREYDSSFQTAAELSIWLAGVKRNRFYCSLKFRHNDLTGWRYDSDLMSPVNEEAREVHLELQQRVAAPNVESIAWTGSKAVVISNWMALHGRGPEPSDEGIRTVQRLYLR